MVAAHPGQTCDTSLLRPNFSRATPSINGPTFVDEWPQKSQDSSWCRGPSLFIDTSGTPGLTRFDVHPPQLAISFLFRGPEAHPLPKLLDVAPFVLGRPLVVGDDFVLETPVVGATVVRTGTPR